MNPSSRNFSLNVVQLATEVIGDRTIQESSGLIEAKLRSEFKGVPVYANSVKSVLSASMYTNDVERKRLDDMFKIGLVGIVNYNTNNMSRVLKQQGQELARMDQAFAEALPILSTRFDRNKVPEGTIFATVPGQKEKCDMGLLLRDFPLIKGTVAHQWKMFAQYVVRKTMPVEIQRVFTAAPNAVSYLAFPKDFLDALKDTILLASHAGINETPRLEPQIRSNVRDAIMHLLNNQRRRGGTGASKKKLFQDAEKAGLVLRDYDVILESMGEESMEDNTDESSINDIRSGPSPTSIFAKRRGPVRGDSRFKKKPKVEIYEEEGIDQSANANEGENVIEYPDEVESAFEPLEYQPLPPLFMGSIANVLFDPTVHTNPRIPL